MSQMHQQAALTNCPSCAEPLEAGDRFCGACGYDLSAAAPRHDMPTVQMNGGAVPRPSAPPEGGTEGDGWPLAPQSDSSGAARMQRPADLPGTDSGGSPLPAQGQHGREPSAAAPEAGVRFDRPAEPEEYPLQAPDPRTAPDGTEGTAALPESGAPVGSGVPGGTGVADSTGVPDGTGVPGETGAVCVACRAGRVDGDGYCENCGHAQPRERDHMERQSGPVAAVSDRGLRHHRNEDAFAVGNAVLPDGSPATVAVVCDGVSSATRPDEASLAASRAASESLLAALPRGTHPQQAMHDAIVAAARAVDALAEEPAGAREHAPQQNSPACTLVGAVVTAGLLIVGWVGDSRVYWVPVDRAAPPARLTEDDSWAAQMVAAGLMSEAQAYADERAHAITGWLGADAYELEPHTASFKPDRPGVVVVCTDGLWNYAESAQEMAEALPLDAAVRPLHSARVLVGHALDGGGHDNVTVAVLPFPAPPQGAGSA
ncbi:protein phosphatase 2C domain-containing protein [Streptomyces sp. NPDC021356]|uniref:protein phosphatase 2C domain-containing protein n=1 Tax=Streptomyces sp. NPDC021356 TaxID=3154900 RepID=UPI0033FD00CD